MSQNGFGRKGRDAGLLEEAPQQTTTVGSVGTPASADLIRRASWAGGTIVVFVLAWLMSGRTISAVDVCRERVLRLGYHQRSIDWEAPVSLRERWQTNNYHARKSYEWRLEVCAHERGEAVITCGLLKCGGLFSLARESTAERLWREDVARRVEWAKRAPDRQAEKLREEQERERKREEERLRVERALERDREGRNYSLQPVRPAR